MTEVRSRLLEGWQHSQLSGSRYTFDVDVEHCPNCGGPLKIIATIDDPPVIVKILSHLGLPTRGQGQLERWLGGLSAVHRAGVGFGVGD